LKTEANEDPKKKFSLEVKGKYDKKRMSTTVESGKAMSFGNSLVNLFRLNFFKVPRIIKKKIRKATPKDSKSKRSQKLKARIQFKKLKKLKRKQRKLFKKQSTLKSPIKGLADKNKMDIEK